MIAIEMIVRLPMAESVRHDRTSLVEIRHTSKRADQCVYPTVSNCLFDRILVQQDSA
jgi:hypothetical protein